VTGRAVVEGIAKSLAKRTVAMALDGRVCDLDEQGLHRFRQHVGAVVADQLERARVGAVEELDAGIVRRDTMPILTFPDGAARSFDAPVTGRAVVEGIAKSLPPARGRSRGGSARARAGRRGRGTRCGHRARRCRRS
jgi:hypothetical protein